MYALPWQCNTESIAKKLADMILHVYNLGKESPVNRAGGTEKAFDIIQCVCTRSVLLMPETEGNIFDVIKGCTKHHHVLSDDRPQALLWAVGENTECLPSPCFRICLETHPV